MTTIAFLGIGLMGGPMAARLAQAGFAVRAWNRTFAKAEALGAGGVEPVAELARAVQGAEVIISMLESGPVVGEVIAAALPALAPATLWIDMSSTRQDEALAFHAALAAHGCRFMDAPVSGGVGGAEAGHWRSWPAAMPGMSTGRSTSCPRWAGRSASVRSAADRWPSCATN